MTYQISKGLTESELSDWLKVAAKKYGPYKDSGISFTKADLAPAVMITVKAGDEFLLVKRAHGLADANGYWSTVNGFIDQDVAVAEIAANELAEELGLDIPASAVKVAKSFTITGSKKKRSYIIFPCLVELDKKPEITLDWEHTDYAWIERKDLDNYHILEGLHEAVDRALALG